MHVHFSHIFGLHHGLKVCCAYPCKALDGWALSSPTFESKHTSYHRVLSWGPEMLVLFLDQRIERALHQLVSVEVNHNYGMTLYAPRRDEEAKVHKEQGHGMTYGGNC